jgi:hypothetical protein
MRKTRQTLRSEAEKDIRAALSQAPFKHSFQYSAYFGDVELKKGSSFSSKLSGLRFSASIHSLQ